MPEMPSQPFLGESFEGWLKSKGYSYNLQSIPSFLQLIVYEPEEQGVSFSIYIDEDKFRERLINLEEYFKQ